MPWVYRDQADFGVANAAKGRRQLLPPLEAQAIRSRQRRYRQPQSSRIQDILRQARQFKERLDATPGLTRDALAREVGINPSQLTRLLHLADLAPEIQQHIRALQPSVGRIVITERRLRAIAKLPSHREQVKRFQELLQSPVRARKRPSMATPVSAPLPTTVPAFGAPGRLSSGVIDELLPEGNRTMKGLVRGVWRRASADCRGNDVGANVRARIYWLRRKGNIVRVG